MIQFSYAQEKTVTGVVSDASGSLPGANVIVKGTKKGVQTDIDGKYSIKAKAGEVLVISFVGKPDSNVTVGSSNTYNVKMASGKELETVVIEGYKTTKKTKSSNAVVTVTAATIEGRPNASFIQTLQGQVAGLNISTGSGQPGSNSTVILRGLGSINGNVEPLYVVDGVALNTDNFRSLNTNDIESISVLKDAGATAIYGNRGANGVIVITTKRGGFESPLTMKYSSTTGFTELQHNKYDVMSSQELLRTEKLYGYGLGSTFTDDQINAYGIDTNWKKYFFRTGVSQNHNLSISSGSKNLSSYTSVGYFTQQGILKTTDLNKFNFRNNLNGRSDDNRFNYSVNTTLNYSRRNEANSLGSGGVNQNYVLGANNSLPYISPDMYQNGAQVLDMYVNDPYFGGALAYTLGYTPLMLIDKLKTSVNQAEEMKIIMDTRMSYSLAKNLVIGSNVGFDYTQNNTLTVQSPTSFNSLLFSNGQAFLGSQNESFTRDIQFTATTNLKYDIAFGEKHSLTAAIFTEYNKGHYKNFGYTQNGLDEIFFSPGNGAGFATHQPGSNYFIPSVGALKIESGMFSYFGTADYDYDNKYGFGATIRRDASFRFQGDNKWGTFWSLSGHWNINKENFMDGSVINLLKLRGSYGTAGNQLITGQNVFNGVNLYANQSSFVGSSYQSIPGYIFSQLGNSNLKWETITQGNVGVDFEVFKSRLTGSLDFYNKTTKDLYQGVPLSAITGFSEINDNYGSLRNRGVELVLKYTVIKNKDFKLTVNGNASYNKNELLSLPGQDGLVWDGGLTANKVGDILDQFYVIKYAGVNPANGNLLFYDKNNRVTENPTDADRVFTGKSPLPKYQGAFGFDATYKGFFLMTQFNFVKDIYRYDYDLSGLQDPTNLGQFNVSRDLFRAWTPDNRVTDIPNLNATNLALDSNSDRYLKDASYIRLRNINLGYNFSKELLAKSFIKGLRTFVQAENIVTWSKWRGWDAESNRGADQYQYPTPKIYSLGLEIQF
jgi:TonB-linked SusC/RagA family outer membrane protein